MQNSHTTAAVMQPYIFPYLGYFQLINAVDVFVFYDDVNFIKQGWINRNQIVNNSQPLKFTIPLEKPSSFKLIYETKINLNLYHNWKDKFLKTLKLNYAKAPFFKKTFDIVKEILEIEDEANIAELAINSITVISKVLEIETQFFISSKEFQYSKNFDREERLFSICKKISAKNYINSLGGQELYNKNNFKNQGICLQFLKPVLKPYKQFDNEFIPGLSIIDVLMFNSKEEVKEMLNQYELI